MERLLATVSLQLPSGPGVARQTSYFGRFLERLLAAGDGPVRPASPKTLAVTRL